MNATTVTIPDGVVSSNSSLVHMADWYKERLAAMEDKTISKAWKMPVNTDFTGVAWRQSFCRVK
jgi:hypothetical protein